MNILINKSQLTILKESYETKNVSSEDFMREVNLFLLNIKTGDPQIKSQFWKINGLSNNDVRNKLLKYDITKYDDSSDSITIPKANFERNVSRLYYEMFPEKDVVTEDDGGGGDFGGNTAGSVGGSFEAPFGSIIKRKMPSL